METNYASPGEALEELIAAEPAVQQPRLSLIKKLEYFDLKDRLTSWKLGRESARKGWAYYSFGLGGFTRNPRDGRRVRPVGHIFEFGEALDMPGWVLLNGVKMVGEPSDKDSETVLQCELNGENFTAITITSSANMPIYQAYCFLGRVETYWGSLVLALEREWPAIQKTA